MYRKQFTFDPKIIERARVVTLRSPDLNVLRDENRAELPGLAHFLEQGFKAHDAEGKLLLPDLSALANRTVGIFSDYGGEDSTRRFFTYSFLVCAFGSLDPFKQQMATLRTKSGIGGKEIAFKDFRWGPLRRMCQPICGYATVISPGFYSPWLSTKRSPLYSGPAMPRPCGV